MIKFEINKKQGKLTTKKAEVYGKVEDLYEELVALTVTVFCTILSRAWKEEPSLEETEAVFEEFCGNCRRVMARLSKRKREEAGRRVR